MNDFCEKLKSIYKSKDKIVSLIQGLKDFPQQSIRDYYVNLQHITTDENGGRKRSNIMTEDCKDIEIENMFTDCGDLANKFLILGVAGVGKSTLLQYMAYKWSCNEIWNMFDYVYKVNLKLLLKQEWKHKYKKKDLNDVLKCFVHYNLLSLMASENEEKEKSEDLSLETLYWPVNKEKVLLMIDGYDEVVHLKQNDEFKLLQNKWFDYNNLILTSRHDAVDTNIKNKFDLIIENVGFDNNGIEQYFSKNFNDKLDWFMKSNSVVKRICNIPVNAALLCYIFNDSKSIEDKICNISDLYSEIVSVLSFRCYEKFIHNENSRNATLQEKFNQRAVKLDELQVLQHLAYNGMTGGGIEIGDDNRNITITFKGNDLESKTITIGSSIRDLKKKKEIRNDLVVSDISKFGLLKPEGKIEKEIENQDFSFIHLTFQEYLTASFLLDKLKTREETKSTLKFIAEYRYEPRYLMVLKFLAGMIESEEKKNTTKDLSKSFWESICCNIDGALELGVEKKVNLLMHLLSQSFNYHDRIPFKELETFIDAVVLSDLLGFGMELKQSFYMSNNIKKALLSGMTYGKLILTEYITEETLHKSTPMLKSILDVIILRTNQVKAEEDFFKSGCIETAVDVIEKFSKEEQEIIIDILLNLIEDSNYKNKWKLLKIYIDSLKNIAKKVKMSVFSIETSERIFEVLKPKVKNRNYSNAALKCIFEVAKSLADQSLFARVSEFFMHSFKHPDTDLKLAVRITHHLIDQITDVELIKKSVIEKFADQLSYETQNIMERVLSPSIEVICSITDEKVTENFIEIYVEIFSNKSRRIRSLAVKNIEKFLVCKYKKDVELVKIVIEKLKRLFSDNCSYVRRAAMRAVFKTVKLIEDNEYRKGNLSELLENFTDTDVYARNKAIKGAIELIESMEDCNNYQTKFIQLLKEMFLDVVNERTNYKNNKFKKSNIQQEDEEDDSDSEDSKDLIFFVNFKPEVMRLVNYEYDISVSFGVFYGVKIINNVKEESVKFVKEVESYLTNDNWQYRYFSAVLSFDLIKNVNNDLVKTLKEKIIGLSDDSNEDVKTIVEKGILELMKIGESEEFISASVKILFKEFSENKVNNMPTIVYGVLKEIKNDNVRLKFLEICFKYFEHKDDKFKNAWVRGLCELTKGIAHIKLFENLKITTLLKDNNMELMKDIFRLTALDVVTNNNMNNDLKNPDSASSCDELSLLLIDIYKQYLKDENKDIRIEIAENAHKLATSTYSINIIEHITELYCELLIDKDFDVIKKALENIIQLKSVLKNHANSQNNWDIVLYGRLTDLLEAKDYSVKKLAAENTNMKLLEDYDFEVQTLCIENLHEIVKKVNDKNTVLHVIEVVIGLFEKDKNNLRSTNSGELLKKFIEKRIKADNEYPEDTFFNVVKAIKIAELIKDTLRSLINQIQDEQKLNNELVEAAETVIGCIKDKNYTEYILEKIYFPIFVDIPPEDKRKEHWKTDFHLMNGLESMLKSMDDEVIIKLITKFAELFEGTSRQVKHLVFGQFDILLGKFDLEKGKIIDTFKRLNMVNKIKHLYGITHERRLSALFKLIMNMKDIALAECIIKEFVQHIENNDKVSAIYKIAENAFKVSFVLLPTFSEYLSHKNKEVREKSVCGLTIWFQILCNRFQELKDPHQDHIYQGLFTEYPFNDVKKSFINFDNFQRHKTDLTVNKTIFEVLKCYFNLKKNTEMEIKNSFSQMNSSNKEKISFGFNKVGNFKGYKIIEMALKTFGSISLSDEDSNFDKLVELSRKILSNEFDILNEEGLKWINENFDALVKLSKESKVFINLLCQNILKNLEVNGLNETLLIKCINQGTTLTLTLKGVVILDGKRNIITKDRDNIEKLASAITASSDDFLAIQYRKNKPLFANSGLGIDIAASDQTAYSILNDGCELEYNKWRISLMHYSDHQKNDLKGVFLLLEGRFVFGDVVTYKITSDKIDLVDLSDSDCYRNVFGDMPITDFAPIYYCNSVYINYTDAKSFIEKIKKKRNESQEETENQRKLIVNWLEEEISWKLPRTWNDYKTLVTINKRKSVEHKENPINCIYIFQKAQLLHITNKEVSEQIDTQYAFFIKINDLTAQIKLIKQEMKELKTQFTDFKHMTHLEQKKLEEKYREEFEKLNKVLNILGAREIEIVNEIFNSLETKTLNQYAKQLYSYFKNFFYCFDLLKGGVLQEKVPSGFLYNGVMGLSLSIIADICSEVPFIGMITNVIKHISNYAYKEVRKRQFEKKQERINKIINRCKEKSEEESLGVELSKIAAKFAKYREEDLETLSSEKFNKRIYKDSKLFTKYLCGRDKVAEELDSGRSLSGCLCEKTIKQILEPPANKRCAGFIYKRI